MKAKDKRYIGFRVPPDVYEALKEICKAEDRPLAYIVEKIICDAVEKK